MGGAGILLNAGGTITNTGAVRGGLGQGGAGLAYNGTGVVLTSGGLVISGSKTSSTALIYGQVGVYAGAGGPATVTNFGTIQGIRGVAVQFKSSGDKLIAESGSTWIGSVQGGGGLLDLANGTGTVTGIGSTGTVSVAEAMTFSGFGSYEFAKGSWTLAGINTIGASQSIIDKAKITSTGALTLNGAISSSGALTVAAGTLAINSGATIAVAAWSLTGGVTSLNETLDFKGAFSQGSAAELTLASGDKLSLSGTATISGLIDGGGSLSASNVTVGKGLVIGGTDALTVTGTAIQGGTITIGDASGAAASLTIAKGANWTIVGAVDIAQGAATTSSLTVGGSLIRSGATGVSTILLATTDTGIIEAAAGTLDLANAVSGNGALKIDAGAVLELDAAAAKGLTTTFNGISATLALKTPATFASTIAGFAVGDTIDLLKIAATGASINAKDQLVIVNGSITVASLQLTGAYSGATFTIGSDRHGGTSITLLTAAAAPPAATSPAPSAQAMVAAMAGLGAGAGVGSMAAAGAQVEAWRPTILARH